MAQKEHPLIVHSFVLMAVGVAVVAWGIVGVVEVATAKPAEPAAQKAAEHAGAKKNPHQGGGVAGGTQAAQQEVQKAQQEVAQTQQSVTALKQKPSLSTIGSQIGAAGQLAGGASLAIPYITGIVTILVGAAIVMSGVFVLKRANWARFVGFAMLTLALVYFAFLQSGPAGLGDRRNDVVLPIVAMLIVTLLASKFLWDLWVEKLEPA